MIQYYKDLIATVTYEETKQFVDKLDFSLKYKFQTEIYNQHIEEEFYYDIRKELFFTKLSELLNKPIDHIVHEMKNAQQPDKILFTQENISKIHISQFEQFLHDRGILTVRKILDMYPAYLYGREVSKSGKLFEVFSSKEDHNVYIPVFSFKFIEGNCTGYCYADQWKHFLQGIGYHVEDGDLTQFHVLFTQVYNEIIGYEIK